MDYLRGYTTFEPTKKDNRFSITINIELFGFPDWKSSLAFLNDMPNMIVPILGGQPFLVTSRDVIRLTRAVHYPPQEPRQEDIPHVDGDDPLDNYNQENG